MYFYFHIVHLKGCRVLYLPKCTVFAGFPANTARLGKYSTLGYRQVTANRHIFRTIIHFHDTVAELKTRYIATLYRVEGEGALPLAVYHCYRHYHLLLLTTGFAYPDCFFSWLRKTIASYTTIHSGCPITIALHRCAFIINYTYTYTYTSTINQLKHCFASGNMEK